jgi:hypothetical protein
MLGNPMIDKQPSDKIKLPFRKVTKQPSKYSISEILTAVSQYKDISSVENWKLSPKQGESFINQLIYTQVKALSEEFKKRLEIARNEIEEYIEYLVGVEGVEMSDYQQEKITEPLIFEITKIELDKYK